METVLISSFSGGEVFRSGMTWTRGAGRIFYFRPGHETHPTYHDKNVLRVIENGVKWAAPAAGGTVPEGCPNSKPVP
jgi:trehalose utilization protein